MTLGYSTCWFDAEQETKKFQEEWRKKLEKIPNMNGIKVGFWRSEYEPEYPFPKENSGVNSTLILNLIHKIMKSKHPDVLAAANMGCSPCRICKKSNGCTEYQWRNYQFPGGYIHYLEDHHVRVDPGFESELLKFKNEILGYPEAKDISEMNQGRN